MNLPSNHQQLMPYILVEHAEHFISFLETVFDAKLLLKKTNDDQKIVHAEMSIGSSTIMLCDSREPWATQSAGIFIYVQNVDKTFQNALREGGTSVMDVQEMEYGRSGGIKDAFGNTWWMTQVE